MSEVAYVLKYPACDICKYEQDRITDAHYDGRTVSGQWGFMCDTHFASRGTGLGTGKGQRLIVGDKPVDTEEEKRRKVREAVESGDLDALEEVIGDDDPAKYF